MHERRLPIVQDSTVQWIAQHWSKDGETTRDRSTFGFLSVPFDYAVSHRPGCRFGPEKILEALNTSALYCADKRVSLADTVIVDYGVVDVVHSFDQSYRNIREAVARVRCRQPVILGGDHSISDPCIRGILDRHPDLRLGVVVFDAHFDSRPVRLGREHSGHWIRTLSDTIDYRRVVQIGISATIYSEEYMRTAENAGILVLTPYQARRNWATALDRAINHAAEDTDGVYVSVDIDSIDQAYAPGTSVPNASGLLAHEVVDAVFEIASRAPIVGFDITEVSPPLDREEMTSRLAAQIIINFMAGVVRHDTRSKIDTSIDASGFGRPNFDRPAGT